MNTAFVCFGGNSWRNVEDLRYENLMQVLINFLKPNFGIKRCTLSQKNEVAFSFRPFGIGLTIRASKLMTMAKKFV